jgi:hypothetical protein
MSINIYKVRNYRFYTYTVPTSISVETILSSALSIHQNLKQVINPQDIALHALQTKADGQQVTR